MQLRTIIKEMQLMPVSIDIDAKTWNYNVIKGREQLEMYAELCSKIFSTENGRSKHFEKLDKAHSDLRDTLLLLEDVKLRTEYYWSRVVLWMDDEQLHNEIILWDLRASQLAKTLRSLQQYYEFDWEVKDMVVLELEGVTTENECRILLEAWNNDLHATDELRNELSEFARQIGPHHCPGHGYGLNSFDC